MKNDDQELKLTFSSKKEYTCPVCDATFRREELLTGSGRLIAGALTEELHRLYEPSVKYGEVYPLVYLATVCPECWFASIDSDFFDLPEKNREAVRNQREKRIADTELIFPGIDFHQPRGLAEGAASLYLALRCYYYYQGQDISPTIKQGLAALRAAWILDEMDKKTPNQHYDWLAVLFRRKAQFLYNEAIRREQNGTETLSAIKNFGPDTDKNYAYEGVLYISAYLCYKYGPAGDPEQRRNSLEDARRTISKIFGMGKTSRDKPGPFMEYTRQIYDDINKELNENTP
ncbi:membrane protein [Spirochaetia bacterium]|nr:membrane protein [Spirochaetia bacterium]